MKAIALILVLVSLSGCAALKKVLRTVDDLADAACTIFGTEYPGEFADLVRNASPKLASKVEKPGFDVGALCDIKEVVQPFIDGQLILQRKTALHARESAGGEVADHSK